MDATFTIHSEPVGKARPRVTSRGTFTPKKTREYEQTVQADFMAQCSGMYFDNKPLQVEITANFPIPKRTPKNQRIDMLAGCIRPTKKPDCDNIAKAILDALNGIAYHDDSQVVTLAVGKWYVPAGDECVIVTIKEV